MNLRTRALLGLVVFSLAPNFACAQTFWTAGVDDWFTASNWNLGVPDAASGTTFDAVIANGGTAQLQAPGGSVFRLRVGRHEGPGHLLIDGGSLTVTGNLHLNEGSTGTASVIVQGGSTVTAPSTVVGYSSDFATSFQIAGAGTVYNATGSFTVGRLGTGSASLTVEDSAVLASGTSAIANVSGSTGGATVTGAGSTWSTTGTFAVGSAVTGVLNIENQGTVYVGTALSIGNSSNVNLNGGTLRFNTISGITRVNYTAGTLQLAGNRDILFDANLFDFYGAPRVILAGKGLTVEGTTTIRQEKVLTVSGGAFTSQGLLTLGAPGFQSGDLIINNAGTVVAGANVSIDASGLASISGVGSSWSVGTDLLVSPTGNGGYLEISNQADLYISNTLSIGSGGVLTFDGGTIRFNGYSRNPNGAFTYTAGTVQLAANRTLGTDAAITDLFGAAPTIPTGKALVVEGTATLAGSSTVTLSGGTLSADKVLMTPGSRITNTVTTQVAGVMLALAGSVIDATGADLTVGDATKVNGFYGNGDLQVGQSTVTLADANDAVLDAATLVTLGSAGSPGTLAAANGLTLNFGGNIIGFGTVDTLDSAATPLINNGHITGMSAEMPISLAGYVKGVGTLDNVIITGTDAPGFSPATVVRGSVEYEGVLEIEIGGAAPGSFDQINHVLGAGLANLGGTLDIKLINGFSPVLGNSFEILTATGGVNGSFITELLPTLTAGLDWNVVYDTNSVMLVVAEAVALLGDYNQDGTVNAADYTVWRNNLGSLTALPNDNTPGVDAGDYDRWKTHFGESAGSGSGIGSNAAVPEPATLGLLVVAIIALAYRRMN
jgi:T5SS/PEP-CTERM-associated repeat protein